MGKKELNLESLARPKIRKAKSSINTDKIIDSIHQKEQEKERMKRITIDLPFSLYVDIRKQIIEEERTLKDYFVELAINDLQSK